MAKRRKVGNLLALAILALLDPGRPMHPYEMATMLRETGKEHDMSIKWGSFYTVVRNLEKHGLIEAAGSSREGRRPERTLYAITAAGKAELTDWLHELVAVPEPEPSRFVAALSVLAVLPPDEVADLLAARLRALEDGIARDRESLAQAGQAVPRIFLIESEFELAMGEAQAAWVRGLLGEITGGTLPGVEQWRHYHASGELPAQYTDLITKGPITKGEPLPGSPGDQ